MSFESIVGHASIKLYLERMIATQKIYRSLLFVGPDGVGKNLCAKQLAQRLLATEGTHPDLHFYAPEGKTALHPIQKMRQMSEEVYMAPFAGTHKIFIIQDAHRMLPTSFNALLKTFEEPPPDTLILLISNNAATLPATILSRCFTLHFQPLSHVEVATFLQEKRQLSADHARDVAHLAQGSIGNALRLLEQGEVGVRKLLLEQLAQGACASYRKLTELASDMAGKIQEVLNLVASNYRQELMEKQDQFTATQRQLLEKEMEGTLANRELEEAHSITSILLNWYRDLHLLRVNGNRAYLAHPDYEEALEQALQRNEILPLEFVQQAVKEMLLSLQRSTPLHFCFETLFLKLRFF